MKLRGEKESSLHILLIRNIAPKDREEILSFPLLLMESETAHIWKKLFHRQILSRFIDYFTFNVFFCLQVMT